MAILRDILRGKAKISRRTFVPFGTVLLWSSLTVERFSDLISLKYKRFTTEGSCVM